VLASLALNSAHFLCNQQWLSKQMKKRQLKEVLPPEQDKRNSNKLVLEERTKPAFCCRTIFSAEQNFQERVTAMQLLRFGRVNRF